MKWILLATIIYHGKPTMMSIELPTRQACVSVKGVMEKNPNLLSFKYMSGACVKGGDAV